MREHKVGKMFTELVDNGLQLVELGRQRLGRVNEEEDHLPQ